MLMSLYREDMLRRTQGLWTVSIERKPFPAKNQTLKILQSIYFAYEVGIISCYSNRINGLGQQSLFWRKAHSCWKTNRCFFCRKMETSTASEKRMFRKQYDQPLCFCDSSVSRLSASLTSSPWSMTVIGAVSTSPRSSFWNSYKK